MATIRPIDQFKFQFDNLYNKSRSLIRHTDGYLRRVDEGVGNLDASHTINAICNANHQLTNTLGMMLLIIDINIDLHPLREDIEPVFNAVKKLIKYARSTTVNVRLADMNSGDLELRKSIASQVKTHIDVCLQHLNKMRSTIKILKKK